MIRIQPIDMTKAREEKQTAWKLLVFQVHIQSDKTKLRKRASYNVITNRTKNFLTLFRIIFGLKYIGNALIRYEAMGKISI